MYADIRSNLGLRVISSNFWGLKSPIRSAGVLKTTLNIYDGTFCENKSRQQFSQKSSVIDAWWCFKYAYKYFLSNIK